MKTESIQNFPAEPGSYALVLQLEQAGSLQVGRRGTTHFQAGIYIYSGSAWGPGGLRARLNRHLEGRGAFHWHIDYLRSIAQVRIIYTLMGGSGQPGAASQPPMPPECLWSQALADLPGASLPAPGFGASDCHSGCQAHLVGFATVPDLLQQILARAADLPVQLIQVWAE